jgi:branched-chain amino acid transport system substrate-binding protein
MTGTMARIAIICLLLLCSAIVRGADREAAEFASATEAMQSGEFAQAIILLEQLIAAYPESPNFDTYLFARAKSSLYAGDATVATRQLRRFVRQHPTSTYFAAAQYHLASALYMQGEINRSIEQYLSAFASSNYRQLERLINESLAAALKSASDISVAATLFDAIPIRKRCDVIATFTAEFASRGMRAEELAMAELCGQIVESDENRSDQLNVAIAVPLSGELGSFGEAIYNGAVIARELIETTEGLSIRVQSFDTKGSPVDAGRIVRELADGQYDAVIGPLTSDEALVASASLSHTTLPMIAPAASEAGLTKLSESAFQLSANVELQGVRMAEYAIDQLSADSAIVLTSTAADHLRMASAFADRFEALGGTVVAVERYSQRDKDFGPYLLDAKAAMLGAQRDSSFFILESGDTLDPDGLPAHVDAIFMPGSASQIRLLLSQVRFYRLRGQYLGSDGWADSDVYRLGDEVTQGAIFPAADTRGRGRNYEQFAAAFDHRYGVQPDRLAALGFDAMMLIGEALRTTDGGRESIISALSSVHRWEGASGRISFGRHRENIEMPLYRIENERANLLGRERPTDTTSTGL